MAAVSAVPHPGTPLPTLHNLHRLHSPPPPGAPLTPLHDLHPTHYTVHTHYKDILLSTNRLVFFSVTKTQILLRGVSHNLASEQKTKPKQAG